MKRKIYKDILRWKKEENGHTALLIEGARRVGKSYIVEEFAKNEYDSFILINFGKVNPIVKHWFDEYLDDLDTLFENLQLHFHKKLTPRHSVIIFDEVQDCPRARESIKYLVEDGRFDYIETGSLISIKKNVKGIIIPSEEETLKMHPMDFEEFLWALGEDMLMPAIRKHFEDLKPMRDFHRRAMDFFRKYLIIGGMPQVVAEYVENKDFGAVDRIKRRILKLYRDDIRQYAEGQELKVTAIFDNIPSQLSKHEKKFKLSSLKANAKFRDFEDSFVWLMESAIVNCCFNSTEPNIGLSMNLDRTSVKCYFLDTGLLISMAFDENGLVKEDLYNKLMFDKLEVNEGMLIENIVAQMLVASKHKLFFFSKYNKEDAKETMEIDFLLAKSNITSRHNISLLEIKSGKNYTLSSLTKAQAKYKQYIDKQYVIHTKDMEITNGIIYLPLYMTGLL